MIQFTQKKGPPVNTVSNYSDPGTSPPEWFEECIRLLLVQSHEAASDNAPPGAAA